MPVVAALCNGGDVVPVDRSDMGIVKELQQVLDRGHCVRSAGQGKDPDISQTGLVIAHAMPRCPKRRLA